MKLTAEFLRSLIQFDGGGTDLENGKEWNLGTIPRGTSREFIYTARAGNVPSGQSAAAPLKVSVTSTETDNNPTDNTEVLDLIVYNPADVYHQGPGRGTYTGDPKLEVVKVANIAATHAPATIEYAIIINNTGGNAYDVKVKDTLTGPLANTVGTQSWNLGTVYGGEEVRIEYTVAYGAEVPPGIYTNTALVTGTKNFDENVYAILMEPVVAKNRLEIRPRGEVLAATTEAELSCDALITENIKPNGKNTKDQVMKLQSFLNNFEGEALDGNGVYDNPTIAAIKRFQVKYIDEVLAPWGITKPTGFVYHTTKRKVNELYCEGKERFDLTDDQWAEINSFRGILPVGDIDEILKSRDVGSIDLGGQNIAEPTKIQKDSVPVIQVLPELEQMIPESPTSTILRETQSFLRSPMQFLNTLFFSMVPFVNALEM